MSTDTREALAALMVIAAECAQRKPLRGFEELTEATHIGHRQFGRAHEQADEAVRMLAVRLRAVFDTLAAALATQPAQPSAQGEAVALTWRLDADAAEQLGRTIGVAFEASPVTLSVCNGHAGHGLYVWCTEYPDDGAILLAATK